MAEFRHKVVQGVHLFHHKRIFLAKREVDQDLLCTENIVVIEQRRIYGIFDSPVHTILSRTNAATHNSYTTVFQSGFHVGKVKIYVSMYSDDLCNALGGGCQRIIGPGKSIQHRQVVIDIP
ncbi:hypothetical protein SDC9_79228 [bioreactor metagenome]|uniref:Uncharacterized protein n=1 Tax=bioreactor metagenome TaxID=1076179 RepID=A0A644Z1R8_9ZZZZ